MTRSTNVVTAVRDWSVIGVLAILMATNVFDVSLLSASSHIGSYGGCRIVSVAGY